MTRKLKVPRGADLLLNYVFPDNITFIGYTAVFNVYNALNGDILVTFGTSPDANSSQIAFTGNVAALVMKLADVDLLPEDPEDDTSPAILQFDLFFTSPGGITSKIDGGAFIVQPFGSSIVANGTDFNVTLEGIDFNIVLESGTAFTESPTGSVRFDVAQDLNDAQKTQARDNIDIIEAIAAEAIVYDAAQSLDGGQKTQALANIGAYSIAQVDAIAATKPDLMANNKIKPQQLPTDFPNGLKRRAVTDGQWKAIPAAAANSWYAVTHSQARGQFVATAAAGTNRVMYSPNGRSWTAVASVDESASWVSVCWAPELKVYAAIGSSGTTRFMTSPDGATWTGGTGPASTWQSICWSPVLSKFVAVANTGANSVATSPDGLTWTGGTIGASGWFGVCYSEELQLFVAVATSGTNRIASSPDGVTWTNRSTIAIAYRSVCWSPYLGLFVAVGDSGTGGKVATSPDGITWTQVVSADDAATWYSVDWSPALGVFAAVALTGALMTSTNGTTWTARIAPEANQWRGICWSPDDNGFIAVGSTGTNRVMASSNADAFIGRARDYGTVGDGVTNNATALTNAFAGDSVLSIDAGSYNLSTTLVPANRNLLFFMSPSAKFPNSKLDLKNMVPWQGYPIISNILASASYNSTDHGTYANIFQMASFVKTTTDHDAGEASVVAVFGQGESAAAGAVAWASNFVGVVNSAGSTAIGIEVNNTTMVAGGTAVGVNITASGVQPSTTALLIGTNNSNATYGKGIYFHDGGAGAYSCVSGELLYNSGGTSTYFLRMEAAQASVAEWRTTNFYIGPSQDPAGAYNYIRLDGSTTANPFLRSRSTAGSNTNFNYGTTGSGAHIFNTGFGGTEVAQFRILHVAAVPDYLTASGGSGSAVVSVGGTSTDANVLISGKGTGGAQMRDGGGTARFACNTTGLSFNGASVTAKPTITGAKGGNAALTSLLTALATMGLITDSTT